MKISKQIKCKGVWGELEVKKCFQRQSLTKYFRQTLVSVWKSALLEKLMSVFQETFATDKIFILGGGLSTRQ